MGQEAVQVRQRGWKGGRDKSGCRREECVCSKCRTLFLTSRGPLLSDELPELQDPDDQKIKNGGGGNA
jgi:hypothetical protein